MHQYSRFHRSLSPLQPRRKPRHKPVLSLSGLGNLGTQHLLKRQTGNRYHTSHPEDSHERQAKQIAQRVLDRDQAPSVTDSSVTQPSRSASGGVFNDPGSPLPVSSRRYFAPRFGQDLEQVRIHDDSTTHAIANRINARAFTQHNHIGFSRGQFNPETQEGKQLLAHEIAHATQASATDGSDTIYRETWNIDDRGRKIERDLQVQLIFKNTWTDSWNDNGWTTARKSRFRNEFVSSIENTFNNSSVTIKPPPSYGDVLPQENIDKGYKPTVDINLIPDSEGSFFEDWEVDVYSNPTGEFQKSKSGTRYGTLDEADNTALTKQGADPGVTQIPTVHEFGHFIGLNHPGKGLEGGFFSKSRLSPRADVYSHTGTDVEGRTVHGPSDLMGSGMDLRSFYYDAWERALDEHVKELRRAVQLRQFQREWNMIERALNNTPEGIEWFVRGISGI